MKNGIRLLELLAPAAMGLAIVRALYLANGSWLNSGSGVLRTSLVLLALGLFAAVWPSGHPWVRAAGLWAGAIAETTVLLFRDVFGLFLGFGIALEIAPAAGGRGGIEGKHEKSLQCHVRPP